ncbi:MAG: D-alanyl-D-alanine carboxypeptidase family protein [Clostridiales bacterium]|nr:D-alanyl-D-alanine carboxypeptidase family protein [Clostridiales bacterium]
MRNKKVISLFLIFLIVFSMTAYRVSAKTELPFDVNAKSALLMDFSSGKILYEKNSHEKLPPASVTKIMTMLLTLEAVDSGKIKLNDMVTVSDYACTMGGTQLFLAPGEKRTVEELLKGVTVESANDAAVALAEYLKGSEELFVKSMNERAKQLGMNDTHFSNCNGLPIENHYTSAYDIAIMSRELLKHSKIFNYTKIWMETISEGRQKPFTMVNKNKMIRTYNGCDGLKTGSTDEAKFCISATAIRNNMRLISVIMASPTRDIRNKEAGKLMDYGFANYEDVKLADKKDVIGKVKVLKGKEPSINAVPRDDFNILIEKGSKSEITKEIRINKTLSAEIKKGQKIGEIIASMNGKEIGSMDIVSDGTVKKASSIDLIGKSFREWITSGK